MTYIDDLRMAIEQRHGGEAHLEEFVPVTVVQLGGVAWDGDVGIFLLEGQPDAKRCYAWGVPDDDEAAFRDITTVLEVPPVVSAETAVKSALASGPRGSRGSA
jgi:hypothetical protein